MALLAGAAVLLVLRLRRRAALPMAAAVAAVVLAVVAYAPLRQRARELTSAAAGKNWDAVVSFRGGPWAAALEMTRERPLLGYGPGTFGAEYVPHRLAAEIRARRRFVSPLLTSSYAETHCDYLQVFSDAGDPGRRPGARRRRRPCWPSRSRTPGADAHPRRSCSRRCSRRGPRPR